ncbi:MULTISPECIES: SulP family inorganic anion transporter [unclassified Moraxella]|uniref:SulP family inorganic anion transporter n=1 Tax=unclassified Moraxella TaxID=2685852 RepID=UPI003AF622D8
MPKPLSLPQLLSWLTSIFRLPHWWRTYQKANFSQDILAGLIVGILVIPQSLGYAMLSGLPPVYGLYSAIVPVLVYAWVGSSAVNAVGPVAITAIMTAQVLAPYHDLSPEQYATMSALLALLTGAMLWLASVFRLGWVTQFISRGVTAGFISGASILIFISQIKYLTGIPITGNSIFHNLSSFISHFHQLHLPTLLLAVTIFGILFINRYYLANWLKKGLKIRLKNHTQTVPLSQVSPSPTAQYDHKISMFIKLLPLLVMVGAILFSVVFDFEQQGIRTIQQIPQGLPHFVLPFLPTSLTQLIDLLPASALMALVAFVSSDSVARSYARKLKQPFDSNQELKGLGLANMVGAFFQSFAVVGGFSRTAVNVDAGAKTPLASIVAVVVMVVALMLFSPLLAPLPYAMLGANIMVAILGMIDLDTLKQAFASDRLDGIAFLVALVGVLVFGLNIGLVLGIMVSFAGLIWQSSHPHIAIVGQVGDTGHFRNINRHSVIEQDTVLIIRIDESLFYGNAESVHGFITQSLLTHPSCRDLVLMLSAVNHIDLTAQEMLVMLNDELNQQGITLHYSEVKGPVMDMIEQTDVIKSLRGKVFLSTQQAVRALEKC